MNPMEKMQNNDQFAVVATSSLTEEKTFILKHDNTFGIFNKYGDIVQNKKSAQGIFHGGTRYLSEYQMRIEGSLPLFLSSHLRERNEMFLADLTNPDIVYDNKVKLEKDLIHIMRKKVVWQSGYYEQIHFHNFGLEEVDFNIEFTVDADFDDIFEVRGTERIKKGIRLPARVEKSAMFLSYIGVDGKERNTNVYFNPEPEVIEANRAEYHIKLRPGQNFIITPTITYALEGKPKPKILNFHRVEKNHKRFLEYVDETTCEITTSNEQFNHWINRSRTDLITMVTETEHGPYPFAGIPWYATPFGRDGIITAFECLWVSPEVSKGVLKYLAATQATEADTFRDSEPGKILHETREGEMAGLNEIPFKQYYGTIDATPLFIVLAGAYFIRTSDIETIESIWPNIELALEWIDQYGDINGDLFVEYERKEESGLFNQGWKDSYDSIMYEDGRIAELPIALCEVQGYVFDAWLKASVLARALGKQDKARNLVTKAEKLQEKFRDKFWSKRKSTFYLAIAGDGNPCRVISSNAGHCLFSGIATQEQAKMVADTLMADDMFSGWGIRTLSAKETRYNPMSYHNGSIWPHDNAMIAYGFARYGLKEEIIRITTALFDASLFSEGQRLPELYCGFKRRKGEAYTSYPVACSPQAWSVATVFMLLQSLLGMEIVENENLVRFYRPTLPGYLDSISIKNLKFKNLQLNLELVRTGSNVSVTLKNKNVPVKIEVFY
jgi:glycogen debranching enzyme